MYICEAEINFQESFAPFGEWWWLYMYVWPIIYIITKNH